jgi:hypothetical protein
LHAWSPRSGRRSYLHAWLRKSLFVGERAGTTQTSTEESINRFVAPITKCCGLAHSILVAQTYYEEHGYEFRTAYQADSADRCGRIKLLLCKFWMPSIQFEFFTHFRHRQRRAN